MQIDIDRAIDPKVPGIAAPSVALAILYIYYTVARAEVRMRAIRIQSIDRIGLTDRSIILSGIFDSECQMRQQSKCRSFYFYSNDTYDVRYVVCSSCSACYYYASQTIGIEISSVCCNFAVFIFSSSQDSNLFRVIALEEEPLYSLDITVISCYNGTLEHTSLLYMCIHMLRSIDFPSFRRQSSPNLQKAHFPSLSHDVYEI